MSSLEEKYQGLQQENLSLKRELESLSTQYSVLANKHQDLIERHRDFIEDAQQNHSKLKGFQEFELQLLSCRTLVSLLQKILFGSIEHFNLTSCRLMIFDPEYRIHQLVDIGQHEEFEDILTFERSLAAFDSLLGKEYKPLLKPLQFEELARWFPWRSDVESAAFIPLVRRNRLKGAVLFGCSSPDRFTANKPTDYMSHLGFTMAICLENSLNHEQLRQLSYLDMLTRVKNRRAFDAELNNEISRSERAKKPLSCLFIDVDHFKKVNDNYGHQTGDEALIKIADTALRQLRSTDHLARYGGEEFAVLLPDCPHDKALTIAERIRLALAEEEVKIKGGGKLRITASLGASTYYPSASTDTIDTDVIGERLVARADEAVYEAKRGGRNRICFKSFSEYQSHPIGHYKLETA